MQRLMVPLAVVFFSLSGCGDSATTTEAELDGAAEKEASQSAGASTNDCSAQRNSDAFEIVPGLNATVIQKGHGRAAKAKDYADVHTTLWLYDENAEGGRGLEIWTSGGAQPFQFQLDMGQVIAGWDLGIPCMLEGEERELIIASELGYGASGKPPVPPNATLLFNVELVRVSEPK